MQSSLLRKATSPLLRSLSTLHFFPPSQRSFWSRTPKPAQPSSPSTSTLSPQSTPTPQQTLSSPQNVGAESLSPGANLDGAESLAPPNWDMKYIDDMDIGGLGESLSGLDLDNLVRGGSTLGFSETFKYFDVNIETLWLYLSMDCGMGMTGGLVSLALLIRSICLPLQVYSQVNSIKSSLLYPDITDIRTRMNHYAQQGNRQAQGAQNKKLSKLNRKHGIYNLFSALNILQIPQSTAMLSTSTNIRKSQQEAYSGSKIQATLILLAFYLSLVECLCGSLFWQAGLYHSLGQTQTLTPNTPQWLRNIRKYLTVLPLLSIPIWTSLPAGFNLYWLVTTLSNLSLNLIIRSTWFRKKMGIYGYLPGTKLARMNQMQPESVIKPAKVFKHRPTKLKLEASSV